MDTNLQPRPDAERTAGSLHRDCSAPTESVVRAMRDQVYGHPSSDKNWEGCRENWMRPDSIQWLRAQIGKAQNNADISDRR